MTQLSLDASYGDHRYMKYKKELEGHEKHDQDKPRLPTKNIGVAIFGLGRIGTVHLENLSKSPRVNILYCIEESTERANFVKYKWKLHEPETRFLTPQEQNIAFEDEKVDAVVICTPTFTHEALVLQSLEAGKAVLCEKPLSLEHKGIEKCLETAKKVKKPLLVAFNRRFDPGFRKLKERVGAGEIGNVQIMKTCSRDSPKPSSGYLKISGGIFHDCAVHDIDYICWVVGEYPIAVSTFAHAYFEDVKEFGDYDTVGIMMKFPSGAIAIIDLSRFAIYGYDQRIEVFGPKGMLTYDEQRSSALRSHSDQGTTAVPIFYSFASRYHEAYEFEMEHFLNVVQGLEECEISGESVLAVSKIATACEKVVNSGKTINLSWEKNYYGF